MNFREKLAYYTLWYLSIADIPEVAILWIEEWYESDNLNILAWISANNNSFEVQEYLDKSMKDLNILFPSNKNAFNILLEYFLLSIKNTSIDFDEGMNKIYKELILPFSDEFGESDKYAYEKSWLSKLWWYYVHYRDVYEDVTSAYLYKKWSDPEKIRKNYKQIIYEEIDICLEKIKQWTLN